MTIQRPLCLINGLHVELPVGDNLEQTLEQRIWPTHSLHAQVAGSAAGSSVSGTAYWVYQGYIAETQFFNGITLFVTTAGVGTQTAEMVFATTSSGPKRAPQTLSKLGVANTALTALTSTGVKRPGVAMNVGVPGGVHLWAGFRQAMLTTQAVCWSFGADLGHGALLTTAAAGALSGAGPWAGLLPTAAVTAQAPALFATLD